MNTVDIAIVALVGAGASEDWKVLVAVFGGAVGLVAASLIVAWLSGTLSAGLSTSSRKAESNGAPRKWVRQLPFIPSSW